MALLPTEVQQGLECLTHLAPASVLYNRVVTRVSEWLCAAPAHHHDAWAALERTTRGSVLHQHVNESRAQDWLRRSTRSHSPAPDETNPQDIPRAILFEDGWVAIFKDDVLVLQGLTADVTVDLIADETTEVSFMYASSSMEQYLFEQGGRFPGETTLSLLESQ